MKKAKCLLLLLLLPIVGLVQTQYVAAEQALVNNKLDIATDRLTTDKQEQTHTQTVVGAETLFNPTDQTHIKQYHQKEETLMKAKQTKLFTQGATKTEVTVPKTTDLNVATAATSTSTTRSSKQQNGGSGIVALFSGLSITAGGGASVLLRRRD
ncbi:type VII secretion protein EssA [Latilactobacillus graminis]|uniref:Type VII secretion protein EssA n=1 Tax=Latilactobacillus graminis TaxID=60519 RepID=A0ABX6CA84_9LACO|nr:type VII secretion protein EssA [Latilactobacillus graminis]QFP79486.1 type VII secretion protein EssA [Latilactobacillus graminis]